jgi:phosphopantothenoylcysteine decarboxylase/phosphopantothenate--cysteine ligase
MGHSIAIAARDRGADVVLISGPTGLVDPPGTDVTHVSTAKDMEFAVLDACNNADAIIMAAAVADYRPITVSERKIKKGQGPRRKLDLVENVDIVSQVPAGIIRVGFAAETNDLVEEATRKLTKKKLDLIVANNITDPHSGFGSDTNKVIFISSSGKVEDLPVMSKNSVAWALLDRLINLLADNKK